SDLAADLAARTPPACGTTPPQPPARPARALATMLPTIYARSSMENHSNRLLELEHGSPVVRHILDVFHVRRDIRALRVEKVRQICGALVELQPRDVSRGLRALEESACLHALNEPLRPEISGVAARDVADDLRRRLGLPERVRVVGRLGLLDLALLLIKDRQRRRDAERQRRRLDRRPTGPCLRVIHRKRDVRKALPAC